MDGTLHRFNNYHDLVIAYWIAMGLKLCILGGLACKGLFSLENKTMDRTHTTYCVKTGQPVGTVTKGYIYPPHVIDPDWIVTDGTNLDTMQGRDARAYAAFCLGIVDTFWRSTTHKSRKVQEALEHHWALVRAYELLGRCSDDYLIELGHALCKFITYAPLSYRVLEQGGKNKAGILPGRKSADLLAESAVAGVLVNSLNAATMKTLHHAENYTKAGASVKTPKFELIPQSINDAATGPSNIRSQTKSREYHKNAKTNKLMAELMREFGGAIWGTVKEKRPQSSALLERLSKHSDNTVSRHSGADEFERDLLDDLERLMTGGFSVEPEMDDEDIVEVRTIPRALVESMNPLPREAQSAPGTSILETAQSPVIPSATNTAPQRRLTLLERLALNAQTTQNKE